MSTYEKNGNNFLPQGNPSDENFGLPCAERDFTSISPRGMFVNHMLEDNQLSRGYWKTTLANITLSEKLAKIRVEGDVSTMRGFYARVGNCYDFVCSSLFSIGSCDTISLWKIQILN